METKFSTLSGTKYPIIQAGMVWVSGWKLACAASKSGILGTLGAGSMNPEILEEHLIAMQKNCKGYNYACNIPLIYKNIDQQIDLIIKYKVPIVISSAGNPATWTATLKKHEIKVLHVVSSLKFALKAEAAGVDAVIAEGFEAGGHNGREESTTLVLLQELRNKLSIPVIAAGGIGSGAAIAAALALGADGVQIGSLFVPTLESSAHELYKQRLIAAQSGETFLSLKSLNPVRLLQNDFFEAVKSAEKRGASKEELLQLLGKGRARAGMFEGDLNQGELEIGQIISTVNEIKSVQQVVDELLADYQAAIQRIRGI
ncbi:MAG: NAD(P)H-dependent flavin oxidoreductase [Luteibaculum sp.]